MLVIITYWSNLPFGTQIKDFPLTIHISIPDIDLQAMVYPAPHG